MSANRSIVIRPAGERGVALVMALLVMALMSALMIGFGSVVTSDQRYRFIDRDRVRAFYAAQSGLEKLSADLANMFYADVSLSNQQIADLGENPPAIPNVTFTTGTEGGVAYGATYVPPEPGETEWNNISSGPYEGLIALKKKYRLDSSVRTTGGGESHLKRTIETVSIPVFQFGIFSDVDLSFSAADTFDFRGRVHTNSNLFLAQGGNVCTPSPCTLWLRDRVTAVKEIVRQRLSNTVSITTSGSTERVRVATAPNNPLTGQAFRDLARTEGSVSDGVGSTPNAAWPTLSLSSYNGYLRTGKTGAKKLNLPLIKPDVGGSNIDLIKRPLEEGVEKSELFAERYFSKVSLRILLSDTAQDIQKLPSVTPTPPVSLDDNWATTPGYGPIDATHPPVAQSPGLGMMFNVTSNNQAGANQVDVQAGANRVIRPDVLPAYFQMQPQLTVTNGVNNYLAACTGKTATMFTGCTLTTLPANVATAAGNLGPLTISAVVDGQPVQTTTVGAWNYVVGGNVNVVTTLKFSHNTFFVGDAPGVVTCGGYTTAGTDVFTECNVPLMIDTSPNPVPASMGARSNAGTSLTGGFIKIERQDPNGTWNDVTLEVLNHGIAGENLGGRLCGDPNPNAIIRLQRLRDNNETVAMPIDVGATCSYAASQRPSDYWPNTLFDTREAIYRDAVPGADPLLGGVIHYVALDVNNLRRWFQADPNGFAQSTGPQSMTDNGGFSVYFSDRRNNRTLTNQETGEYGFEDVVNPASGAGTPNNSLNPGEDMNASTALETYGQFPSFNGTSQSVAPCAACPGLPVAQRSLTVNHRPWQAVAGGVAKANRAILFRRALKLINGGLNNIVAPGFTVASENPVYIQGDWNATTQANGSDPFLEPNVATSVAADAVTLLSRTWNDNNSFAAPYDASNRNVRSNTSYRLAIISGKGPIFPRPANGEGATFGTDGGVHSFLRFLEGGNGTVAYRGSMATLYYHRQAISPFKCCGVAQPVGGIVYEVPTRAYAFDLDFLDPALLPPLTPMFRDLNALGFTQETRPGK